MIAERAPTQANRTFAAIRSVFSWAMSEDLIEASPCFGLKAPTKEHPRDRVFTTDEIRAIFQGLPGTELEHLVRLLFYTGTRSRETRSARWAEIDLESRLWTIPGDKSKNREVHPVPLSSRALDVLSRLPVSNEWVFPAPRAQGAFMIHSTRPMMEIRQRSGIADFRFHDIRRTVATRLSELGTLDSVVEAVLGHTPPRLKRTYNRYQPIREMRTALEAWASTLDGITQGKRSIVLPLRRAR